MTKIIAHRGASGYLPEHTLAAKVLAFAQGADFLEQDVVLTKDQVPVVLHDIHLDTTTDVARVYPGRARSDGHWYAIDFTIDEIRRLRVHERKHAASPDQVYPSRFPAAASRFGVPTLAEEIELIQGLAQTLGRPCPGIYPELKAPAWHHEQGVDLARVVMELLPQYGYQTRDANVRVQCFDAAETRRLRTEFRSELPLVQLVSGKPWSELVQPGREEDLNAALARVAEYADGVGPHLSLVVSRFAAGPGSQITPFVAAARRQGLFVDAWTIRRDDLPPGVTFPQYIHAVCREAGVDGVFTDFPDITRSLLTN